MSERLQEMISNFNANLRPHYEAQASAIQVDINLVLRANPYENTPLEDSTEEIEKQIAAVVGDKIPADAVAREDFVAEAGKMYSEYIRRVNDAMEDRDVNLTLLNVGILIKTRVRPTTNSDRTNTRAACTRSSSGTSSKSSLLKRSTDCLPKPYENGWWSP